jgi:hypothetical protein
MVRSVNLTFDFVFADVDKGGRRRGIRGEIIHHLAEVYSIWFGKLGLGVLRRIVNLASTCGV